MINPTLYKRALFIIAFIYVLSFLAFQSSILNILSFVFILGITALLTWQRLSYGVLVLLAELMLSSQGHLFDLTIGGFRFSLRMGIFVVLLLVWFITTLIPLFLAKNRSLEKDAKEKNFDAVSARVSRTTSAPWHIKTLLQQKQEASSAPTHLGIRILAYAKRLYAPLGTQLVNYKFYALLALFIIWGLIQGIRNDNSFSFLYQDINAFLFFLLLPVFVAAVHKPNTTHKEQSWSTFARNFLSLFAAALTWQFIISLVLLFLYGHLDVFWRSLVPLYAWFRDQRIIEVGLFRFNFYRVFMQSGIWALMGLFVFGAQWLLKPHADKASANKKESTFFNSKTALITLIITIIIISLSRSFWLAGVVTAVLFCWFYLWHNRPTLKIALTQAGTLVGMFVVSVIIISATLLVPVGQIPGLKALAAIPTRAIETEEVAISSRRALLLPIWQGIQAQPIQGHGFGATVTYKTDDPRYLEAHPDNPYYTTFAFEWGWLDLWYKIGLIGLIAYLLLIGDILWRGWGIVKKTQEPLILGLSFGLIALTIVHFFTPFLNHPLGIGYILLTDALFRQHPNNEHFPTPKDSSSSSSFASFLPL